jgi:hypothetical protein
MHYLNVMYSIETLHCMQSVQMQWLAPQIPFKDKEKLIVRQQVHEIYTIRSPRAHDMFQLE